MQQGLPGAVKGVVVGVGNTVLVAFCIAVMVEDAFVEPFFLIVSYGLVPGLMTGALLGHIAADLKHSNRAIVLVFLIVISCAAVMALGEMFRMEELVFTSCIPTAAACSVLERWTRAKPATNALPLARVA